MTKKRILSLVLAMLMVLTILPTAIVEGEPDVVYGYSIGCNVFYSCDENGNYDPEKSIDPNTITHLFVQPEMSDPYLTPLRLSDRTNLRWLNVLDLYGQGVSFVRDAFSGYVNLEEVCLAETANCTDLELFENTNLRSLTLPRLGSVDTSFLQGCQTIEEIINPSQQDVPLTVHYEDIVVPAGGTWHADFGADKRYLHSTPGASLSVNLKAFGADEANPVVWSFTENEALPEGFTLTEDGVLTGLYPASHNEVEYIYVTATNGDQSADTYVYLEAFDAVTVTVKESDFVTLKDGPVGEKALDTRAPAVYSFALSDTLPEGTSFLDVTLTEIRQDGSADSIGSYRYSLRDNVLYLDAEAVDPGTAELVIEPLVGQDLPDAANAATAITLPYEELLDETTYPITLFPDYDLYESNAYEADLSKGDKVNLSLVNWEDEGQDTRIFIYYENEYDELELLQMIDSDAVGYGEQAAFYVKNNATHYIFAVCSHDSTLTGCTFTADVQKNVIPFPENTEITSALRFDDEENLPSPNPDALWTWDNNTKTLTLKDGFVLNVGNEDGIVLPPQSTIIVEGKAIATAGDDVIQSLGDLTIELKAKADLILISDNDYAIEVDEGLLKVIGEKKTAKLSAYAPGDDGIYVGEVSYVYDEATGSSDDVLKNGQIEMSNLTLYVLSEDDAVQTYEGDITMTDCNVTIESGSDALLADNFLDEPTKATITLTNCKLDLACVDQAIENYCGGLVMTDCDTNLTGEATICITGDITVTGGRLIAEAVSSPALVVNGDYVDSANITLNDVAMKLQIKWYAWLFEGAIDHVIIESPYDLCYANDADGILHIGEWNEESYFELVNSDRIPTLLQSVVYGDIEGDLTVSAADALMALKSVVGKVELGDYETLMGDVDGDKTITATDALLILQKVVGKIQKFPVQEM